MKQAVVVFWGRLFMNSQSNNQAWICVFDSGVYVCVGKFDKKLIVQLSKK